MAKRKNVIAPEAQAMDKMALSGKEADKLWGDGQPFDLVRVETRIGINNNTVIEGMVASGRDYLWARAHLKHGEFMALVDRTASSHTYVLNCMRFADMYRNSAHVPNLGVRRTKALTLLDKPVVEKYLSGGPLGDVPHDDVAEMSVTQLEEEVRKLREKVKRTEAVAKDKIRQKDEQITKLEFENENRLPPTKEQIAQAALQELTLKFTGTLAHINTYLREACATVVKAEKIENVNVQQLSDWLGQFYDNEIKTFRELSEAWLNEIDNAGPMQDWRISDLPK